MHILVYGTGAVGCYLGAHLSLAGHQVTLLGRSSLCEAVQRSGLHLHTADGRQIPIPGVTCVTELSDAFVQTPRYDCILFTMKSYDTVAAIMALHQVLPDGTPLPALACFQNGVGNEESLRSAFGTDAVVAATLTSPVSLNGAAVTEEKARGIAIASDSSAAQDVIEAFRRTALPLTVVPNSGDLKWSKLLLNMLTNATCAALDMTPADIMANPALFDLERAALLEALYIMDLHGYKAVDLPGAPAAQLAGVIRKAPAWLARLLLMRKVGQGRGAKLPSLLLDLRSGKPVTEVEWLNGAVVKFADQQDRLAPVNHVLALTIFDIASRRAPWEMYRSQPEMLLTAVRASTRRPA